MNEILLFFLLVEIEHVFGRVKYILRYLVASVFHYHVAHFEGKVHFVIFLEIAQEVFQVLHLPSRAYDVGLEPVLLIIHFEGLEHVHVAEVPDVKVHLVERVELLPELLVVDVAGLHLVAGETQNGPVAEQVLVRWLI